MAAGGAAEERRLQRCTINNLRVLSPFGILLTAASLVPRKARSGAAQPRAATSKWWSFKLPVAPPPSPSTARPRRRRVRRAPPRVSSKRRCSHCESSETPQWRTGPAGRATLCNACGMRHIKGGLLPEYHPTVSPSFDPTEHTCMHSHAGDGMEHSHAGGELLIPDPIPEDQLPLDGPPAPQVVERGGDGLLMGEQIPLDLEQMVLDAIAGSPMGSLDDSFLFGGPSAPMIVDDEDFVD